jgi:glyoxylate/hydroxypyruvate reductase
MTARTALLFFSPLDDPRAWRTALERRLPSLEVREPNAGGAVEDIRFALVFRPPPGLLASLPNLQAIFSLAAGVEGLLADPTLPDVPVCRLVDPSLRRTMAEYVLAAVWRVHRGFDRFARDQAVGRWAFEPPRLAESTTVGVLGLGDIGGAVAMGLAGAGFSVRGWSRRGRTLPGVRSHAGPDGFRAMLAGLDVLVSVLPGTAETRDLIDARVFAALGPGAHFVNVGRAEALVEADLLAALDEGHLGGATLDVFRKEPLAPDHPFWRHPRVLMTPHVAGFPLPETAAAAVADNVERAMAGLALMHVVDRRLGY